MGSGLGTSVLCKREQNLFSNTCRLDFRRPFESGLRSSPRRKKSEGRATWAQFPEQRLVIEPRIHVALYYFLTLFVLFIFPILFLLKNTLRRFQDKFQTLKRRQITIMTAMSANEPPLIIPSLRRRRTWPPVISGTLPAVKSVCDAGYIIPSVSPAAWGILCKMTRSVLYFSGGFNANYCVFVLLSLVGVQFGTLLWANK